MAATPRSRHRRSFSWAISLAMIAFAFFIAGPAHAHPLGIPAGSAQEKNIDPVEPESPGWLILRGEPVPGPYRVEVVNHNVMVNGRSIDPPVESTSSPSIDREHAAREKLFQQFQSIWEDSVELEGLSAAQRDAVIFWQSSPIVAKAELSPASASELLVLFRGERTSEHVALTAPDSSSPLPDELRDENLRAWASNLEDALTHGHLAVVQGQGYVFVAPAGESAELLQELREIVAAVSDREEKIRAVRKLVPDDEMARDIAERFR